MPLGRAAGPIGSPSSANLQPADRLSQVAYEDVPDPPIAISGGCFERYFDVTEAFTIDQVQLGLTAAHDRRDDLQVELQSPDGTTVRVLADDEVSGTEFHNYDVLLLDAAMQVYATGEDDPAWPYYNRLARPYAPLQAFQGERSDGLWTLRICDLNAATNDGTYIRSLLELWPRQAQMSPSARWSYNLLNVGVADYVSQTIAIYGEDVVDNRSTQPLSLTIWIDNVSPTITVTQVVADAQAGESEAFVSGLVQDGGPLSGVYVMIEPPAGDAYIEPAVLDGDTWQHTVQSDTGGRYRLWFSAADLAENLVTDGPYEIDMPAPPGAPRIYLPLVFQGTAPPSTPDLVVSDQVMLASTGDSEIVIVNQGGASVITDFRVDLYFDPTRVPQSGDRWSDIATYGAHWVVPAASQPLAVNGRITLTLPSAAGDNYPAQIAIFTHAYIQVDTLNTVLETDEGNNVLEVDISDIDEPDLIVENLTVTANNVQVVIKNQGEATVNDEFWVDVYIDPDPPPTAVNQIWNDIASEGLVWGVTADLRPGEVLTLTIGDAYYQAAYSHVHWPLPIGIPVYAQVDSSNANTLYGGVLEMHEVIGGAYNNIAGPVSATVAGNGDYPRVAYRPEPSLNPN
jgi:subtilisin-like proprotein convertase family protein/archaellum component FlaG (FlaF/FlaG flagellin family)